MAAPVDSLVVYGPLGIFVLAFTFGLIVARPIYDRAIADRDRAELQREALTKDVTERVAPVLERAIETLNARADTDAVLIDVLTDVRRLLEQR